MSLGQAGAATATDPVTLKVGWLREPNCLSMFQACENGRAGPLMYDSLIGLDPAYKAVSGFAKDWTAAPDHSSWTFTTWDDMKWSDGTPAGAADIAFTIDYLKGSKGDPNELNAGWLNTTWLDTITGYELVDDQTIILETAAPVLDPETFFEFWIMPKHIWSGVSYAQAMTGGDDTLPIVGSGPFQACEWAKGQFIRFCRNANYHGDWTGRQPQLDEVVHVYYATPDAEVAALKSGEIDAAMDVPITQFAGLEAEANVTPVSAITFEYALMAFNLRTDAPVSTNAIQDPAFRDAIGYAIDTGELVEKIRAGQGTPSSTAVGPGLVGFFDPVEAGLTDIKRTFDLAEAGRRLDAAGYPDSDGDGVREDHDGRPLTLRLSVSADSPDYAKAAEFIVDWLRGVGIDLQATTVDGATLASQLYTATASDADWDLAIAWDWPNFTIASVLESSTSHQIGLYNAPGWSNPEYDALWDELHAASPEERVEIATEAARLWYTESPFITLWHTRLVQAYRSDRFEGWTLQPDPGGQLIAWYPSPSYMSVHPVGAAASSGEPATTNGPSPSTGPTDPGSSTTSPGVPTVVLGAAGLVAIAGVGLWFIRRRRDA
jgi:peptide/nickel transport system substrate-binding protein